MIPATEVAAAGVVCHAHPLHGGMMHFKAVFRAAKALQRENVVALRFNFRGVGRSEGSYDDGRGEQDDVRAALDALEERFPGLPLILGGFSFGAEMALRVGVEDSRARALFAMGFVVEQVEDTSFLEGSRKPCLFVQGERDEFSPGESIERLGARLPEPREVVIVPESDHFFSGHLGELEDAVARWVSKEPWGTRGPG